MFPYDQITVCIFGKNIIEGMVCPHCTSVYDFPGDTDFDHLVKDMC